LAFPQLAAYFSATRRTLICGTRGERPGGKPAGRPARSAESAEIEKLKTENEKLTAELARTKAALEVVGKAHALLELLSESADSGAKRPR
jgi:hypothetical protein